MDDATPLPDYTAEHFRLSDPPECDVIMKGGITSGIVYPYAILEIATKYRFRSIGGTSAGAIASAFAAAAEYARLNGRPEGFLLLKHYCDELPDILLSLFQPAAELRPAADRLRKAIASGGAGPIVRDILFAALPWSLLSAAVLGGATWAFEGGKAATIMAALLGGICGFAFGIYRAARRKYVQPALTLLAKLPENNFGICTGLTSTGSDRPALTDWMYRALQHIAFGDPDHPKPLTFGDLVGSDPDHPRINLRTVTTNLSMRRPHTLPRLGIPTAFMPEEWERLFPEPVMAHLYASSKPWQRFKGSWLFPPEDKVPVLVAVRMSLSFPLLFAAVPMKMEDMELPSIVKSLGGTSYKRIRTVHFSDGGISSNFPIHMFDALLPSRPTFAFSLEDLLWNPEELKRRVALPVSAQEGMGVQISEIRDLKTFAWQILNSAKDWQDQLLSEITGQRERVARIYLTDKEGGLNLSMPAETSRKLMMWGHEAGKKFTSGDFDFDEHKWRRLLVLYKHLKERLREADRAWAGGFERWYAAYLEDPKSYKKLTATDRHRIAEDLNALFEAVKAFDREPAMKNPEQKLPRKSGVLRVGPRY